MRGIRKFICILFMVTVLFALFSGCVTKQKLVYPSSSSSSLNSDSTGQEHQAEYSETSQSSIETDAEDDKLMIDIQPAEKSELELVKYNGGFFSIDLPSNWVIETTGEYQNFGFHAYDPQNTSRSIFFYGNMRYFMKS